MVVRVDYLAMKMGCVRDTGSLDDALAAWHFWCVRARMVINAFWNPIILYYLYSFLAKGLILALWFALLFCYV